MKNVKNILLIVVAVIVVVGGYFLYTYWNDTTTYVSTDNASVSANMVTITPLISGNVISWDVKEGAEVTAGQILGKQDLENLVQSSTMNAQSLGQSAGANIAKADIKTPIAGKVVQSNVVVGETIAPGMQVAIVADTNHMYVKANIEEELVNRISAGQQVIVKIDAYPNVTFSGIVESVGEATQSAFSSSVSLTTSGTYTKVTQLVPVKINVSGMEDYKLRLGYNATVKIKTK